MRCASSIDRLKYVDRVPGAFTLSRRRTNCSPVSMPFSNFTPYSELSNLSSTAQHPQNRHPGSRSRHSRHHPHSTALCKHRRPHWLSPPFSVHARWVQLLRQLLHCCPAHLCRRVLFLLVVFQTLLTRASGSCLHRDCNRIEGNHVRTCGSGQW
jgi:hypothetical protein